MAGKTAAFFYIYYLLLRIILMPTHHFGTFETLHFNAPLNNEQRAIRVWLPNHYHARRATPYPVIYGWDGQNLFNDDAASFNMAWQLHRSLTELNAEVVVIGIDCPHGDSFARYQEYSAFDWMHPQVGNIDAHGKQTVDHLVDVLMPMLQQRYNISTERQQRTLLGSSMGGQISLFALAYRPDLFGNVFAFSHATSDVYGGAKLRDYLTQQGVPHNTTVYIDAGMQEVVKPWNAAVWVTAQQQMLATLQPLLPKVMHCIDPDGEHNERSWARRFKALYAELQALQRSQEPKNVYNV